MLSRHAQRHLGMSFKQYLLITTALSRPGGNVRRIAEEVMDTNDLHGAIERLR